MITIKSFTDIKQSRKLAEFLPLESADMCYVIDYAESNKYGTDHFKLEVDTYGLKVKTRDNIPAWSLAALLKLMQVPYQLTSNNEGKCQLMLINNLRHDWYDNPLDAAFEMVCWLIEQKTY